MALNVLEFLFLSRFQTVSDFMAYTYLHNGVNHILINCLVCIRTAFYSSLWFLNSLS